MVELLKGNVTLKPCQKRRLLAQMRRCDRLSDRLGDSRLAISLRRTGRTIEARAKVHNRRGDFECHARDARWESAIGDLIRTVHGRVHAQRLRGAAG